MSWREIALSWMNLSTLLAVFAGIAICIRKWLVGQDAWRLKQKALSRAGLAVLFVTWAGLVPASLYLWHTGQSAPWLFGAETYDGGVVETVTAVGLIAIALLAAREVLRSDTTVKAAFWGVVAGFGVLAFGEEASWGQHLFQWSATGAFATQNLQAETNLHNFVSPRLYDIAYAVVGWGFIVLAGVLTLRPRRLAPVFRHAPFSQASLVRIALLVSAGTLLQHEVFEELAEAVAILAVVFIQGQLALVAPVVVPASRAAAFAASGITTRPDTVSR